VLSGHQEQHFFCKN